MINVECPVLTAPTAVVSYSHRGLLARFSLVVRIIVRVVVSAMVSVRVLLTVKSF